MVVSDRVVSLPWKLSEGAEFLYQSPKHISEKLGNFSLLFSTNDKTKQNRAKYSLLCLSVKSTQTGALEELTAPPNLITVNGKTAALCLSVKCPLGSWKRFILAMELWPVALILFCTAIYKEEVSIWDALINHPFFLSSLTWERGIDRTRGRETSKIQIHCTYIKKHLL